MSKSIKITSDEELDQLAKTNAALKDKLAEATAKANELKAKQTTTPKTTDMLTQIRESILAEQKNLQATEQRLAKNKDIDTPEAFENRFLDKALLEMETKHLAEKAALANTYGNKKQAPKVKQPFQSFHVPGMEYILHFNADDGCLLQSTRKNFAGTILSVKSMEVIRVKDNTTEAVPMKGFNGVFKVNQGEWVNRNLSLAEFKQLVSAKPIFNQIQSAYKTAVLNMEELQDFNKRIDTSKAVVCW